jgi:hypothetical protein
MVAGFLHRLEKHSNKTVEESSLFWKLLIVRVNSSAIITFLITSVLKGSHGTNEETALKQVRRGAVLVQPHWFWRCGCFIALQLLQRYYCGCVHYYSYRPMGLQ